MSDAAMGDAKSVVAEEPWDDLDWAATSAALDEEGYALTPPLLSPAECQRLIALYDDSERFRSRVIMRRHGFGQGEYQYFAYPLPSVVEALRTAFYPALANIANDWHARLGIDERYPTDHAAYLKRCHDIGQTRPTPLILKYGAGDENRLHQDLYGALHFPLQLAILLNAPGKDFDGGELVLTEQKPRMQSRVAVVPLAQGQGVIFPVQHRPGKGTRGYHRLTLRHGVSRIRRGARHTLGIIFHDAA